MSAELAALMAIVEDLRGHLGAAKVQRAPSDDQIIADHIDAAYDLALRAERMIDCGIGDDHRGLAHHCGRVAFRSRRGRADCPYQLPELRDAWFEGWESLAEAAARHSDPCTEEARDHGCTCRLSVVRSNDIDPPEPVIDRDCPLHGNAPDPDYELGRRRDESVDASLIALGVDVGA